jgi:serine/threonine protein kinase
MPLASGTRLGPYEILAPIGAGGMGEVYRARDTKLGRDVALKILPEGFAQDAERVARFEREAQVLAALNHPNIAQIYGVEDHALVMELVEGQPLKGPLPLEKAIKYATQFLDALDAAHRKGITHRDLKPANILVTKQGIKLLDFGLAKLTSIPATGDATKTIALTKDNAILGTLQYMSPEQLESKEADARSDIFAFGAVLYEMVTGARAFNGTSQASLISAIMTSEPPPLSTLQPMTPPALDRVVKKCLAKDPENRWQTARDLRDELKWIADSGQAATPTMVRRSKLRDRLVWGVTLLAVLSIVVAWGLRNSSTARTETQTVRLSVVTPETSSLLDFAISPDGRTLAFVARDEGGKELLWVRRLDVTTAQPLSGTEGAAMPFWAPDSRSLGFFADGKLKKVEAAGGPPQTIAEAGSSRGGTWNSHGVILFAPAAAGGLFRVSGDGGALTPVTVLDLKKESSHRWPQFLPDGRHFLFFAQAGRGGGVSVGSLDFNETKHLLDTNVQAWYAPPGFLLFVRGGSLMAQSFEPSKAELQGTPFRIAEGLMLDFTNHAAFSTAWAGTLAYRSSSHPNQMAWFSRSGKPLGTVGPRGRFYNPELSPDTKQVAFNQVDLQTGNSAVWLLDLARDEPRRLTFDSGVHIIPRWSPDGKQIVLASNREGAYAVYQKLSSGAGNEERLSTSLVNESAQDWSSDGRFLLLQVLDAKGNSQVWGLPLFGDRKPIAIVENGANNYYAQFSHDGRWVAYASNDSGRYEVYVRSFPAGNGQWQVSTNGGVQPRWRRDGKELFYLALDRKLMAVPVRGVSTLEFGAGVPLFEARTESVRPSRLAGCSSTM